MFRTQDCVENLDRRLQKLNESPYRKEMKNIGRPLNQNCKGKKENRDDTKRVKITRKDKTWKWKR